MSRVKISHFNDHCPVFRLFPDRYSSFQRLSNT